jgi:U2 small nuclear ribonucleoprotein B''
MQWGWRYFCVGCASPYCAFVTMAEEPAPVVAEAPAAAIAADGDSAASQVNSDSREGADTARQAGVKRTRDEVESSTSGGIVPNPTVYIKNLDWKLKKQVLKRALYTLGSRYGKVLDIVALRNDTCRGQAFLIMNDTAAATAVIHKCQGLNFFGKDLVLQYSKSTSDKIAKRDGTYVPKSKRNKKQPVSKPLESSAPAAESTSTAEAAADNPPSRFLILHQVTSDVTQEMLQGLFSPYHGYVNCQLVPSSATAIVEFQGEPYATLTLQTLQNFQFTHFYKLKFTYGKE